MAYFLTFHWGWLLGSLLLGLGMGWIAVVQHGDGLSNAALQRIALLLAVLAVARIIPGRPGYWLDLGLVMFVSYLIGCAVGSGLRDRFMVTHALPQEPPSRAGATGEES